MGRETHKIQDIICPLYVLICPNIIGKQLGIHKVETIEEGKAVWQ